LAVEGLDKITLEFVVTNEGLLGNTDRESVFGREMTIELEDGGMTLEDVYHARGIRKFGDTEVQGV
ncbi:hypothetical protein QX233_22345, partial [Chryseobacterium gambrini]